MGSSVTGLPWILCASGSSILIAMAFQSDSPSSIRPKSPSTFTWTTSPSERTFKYRTEKPNLQPWIFFSFPVPICHLVIIIHRYNSLPQMFFTLYLHSSFADIKLNLLQINSLWQVRNLPAFLQFCLSKSSLFISPLHSKPYQLSSFWPCLSLKLYRTACSVQRPPLRTESNSTLVRLHAFSFMDLNLCPNHSDAPLQFILQIPSFIHKPQSILSLHSNVIL